MSQHRAVPKVGPVVAYRLRRRLARQLDALVANALTGTQLAPGTAQLNRYVQARQMPKQLTDRLLSQPAIATLLASEEFAALGIQQHQRSGWVAEAIRRVHRRELDVRTDELRVNA